jgi:ABC-type multidrug transport system ATPase subunit
MSKGKIVAEGIPRELIEKQVRRYALEIRDAEDVELRGGENILSTRRGTAHVYFAEDAELLTPLIHHYGNRPVLLRPSNLEDVFLQLVEEGSE